MTTSRAEEFTLEDVPARPVLRVDFVADDAGDEWSLVDGAPVAPVAGLSAREAALRHVAGIVDGVGGRDRFGRPAPAVRVEASAPSGAILHLVVHRDGRVFVDRPPAAANSAPTADEPWPDVDAGTWPRPRPPHAPDAVAPVPLLESGDPGPDFGEAWPDIAPAVGQPVPTGPTPPDGPAPSRPARIAADQRRTPPSAPSPRGGATPRPAVPTNPPTGADVAPRPAGAATARRSRRVALSPRALVASLVTVLLLAGLGVWGAGFLRSTPDTEVRTGSEATFPGPAPDGWAAQARWASPRLAPDSGPAVPLDDGVAFVSHDRDLVVVEAATGGVRWSERLADGAFVGGLHRTSIAGKDVLAIQTGARLSWWPVGGGRGNHIDLPPNARTSYYGPAPLVGVDAKTAAVILADRLTRVPVPGGAYPLAARADGTVTAASSQGWWHLTPGQAAPMVTPWEDPDPSGAARGAMPRLIGYTGGTLLILFPPDKQGQTFVVTYADHPRAVLVNFRGRVAGADPATAPWHPSPTGTWGILGHTLVDLDAGRVTDLGAGWQTRLIAEDRAVGLIGDSPVIAGPSIPRGVLRTGTAFPERVTKQGALVRAEVDGGQVVYLLPPA